MNRKCKFCGYTFKDRDETICPECFTAREEDISCGSFDHEDHCHNSYEHYSNIDRSYNANDTFDDDNSFINEIKREEKNDSFANKVQEQADSVKGSQNYQNNYNAAGSNNFGFKNSYNNNNKYNYTAPKTNPPGFDQINFNNINKGKKKAPGCLVAFIVIMFIMPFIISILSTIGGQIAENKLDKYIEKKFDDSDIKYQDMYIDDKNNIHIVAALQESGDDEIDADESAKGKKGVVLFSDETTTLVPINVVIKYEKFDKNKKPKFVALTCTARDSDQKQLSISNRYTVYSEDNTDTCPFYIDQDAEYLEISGDLIIDGDIKRCSVKLNLNDYE